MRLLGAGLAAILVSAAARGDDVAPLSVEIDGSPFPVEAARHSAFPLNQTWPGYERPISQSRLDGFVRFDLRHPVTLSVKLPTGANPDDVKLRPYGYAERLKVANGQASVYLDRPRKYVIEFGEKLPQLHVFADPPFEHRPVPGELYFGPGVHDAGVICPTNGQTVCIDSGATVYGALMLESVTNVTVCGHGILDSSRIRRTHADGCYLRSLTADEKSRLIDVTAFMCRRSENVRIDGIVLRDSPFWVMVFREDCRHVRIRNVKIVGQWRYNSDGIDICGCKDVVVTDSFIRSFDDSFVVRDGFGGGEESVSRDISCEGSLLWCDWGGNFKAQLSFADNACIERVKVRRCVFAHVQNWGIIIAARPGGIDGVIRDVAVEDIEFDLAPMRYKQRMQKRDEPDEPFVFERQTMLKLLDVMNYDWQRKPLSRISLLYDRLAFRRFKIFGPYDSILAHVQLTAGKEEVRDLMVEGLPSDTVWSKRATFTHSSGDKEGKACR